MASSPDLVQYISDIDDSDYLAALIKATLPALPLPKPRKKPATKG